MTLKLYWAPRSRSFRILWLLEEIGVPYEKILVDIHKGEQSTAEYKAINPMAKVPALADGDARVAESGAICAYLADKFPGARLAPPGRPPQGPLSSVAVLFFRRHRARNYSNFCEIRNSAQPSRMGRRGTCMVGS